jgi:hypothetical protein
VAKALCTRQLGKRTPQRFKGKIKDYSIIVTRAVAGYAESKSFSVKETNYRKSLFSSKAAVQ